MENIKREVYETILKECQVEASPLDIIETGVKLLEGKSINKPLKKEIMKAIIQRIVLGEDGVRGTIDDRFSVETTTLLLIMVESELLDCIIEGVVAKIKKVQMFLCFRL